MTETISNANAAASTLFLGHNGEWWDFWLIFSVIAAALVATAIGVTTAGSIVSHKRETLAAEIALNRYKLDTEDKISDANARAAEATARALESKLELEKFKSPRLLSDQQILALAAKMKPFAGTRFDVAVIPGDPEAFIFMSYITASLENAGWHWADWGSSGGGTYSLPGKPNIGTLAFFGVMLQVNPAHDSTLGHPADVLASWLIGEGFEATLDVIDNTSIPNKDTVHILLGKKRR